MSRVLDIEVVHVRDYGKKSKMVTPSVAYFYCGRGGGWGNDNVMRHESQRDEVVELYEADEKNKDAVQAMIQWIDTHPEVGNIKLGCFCAPKRCHCDVIKKWVHEAFD